MIVKNENAAPGFDTPLSDSLVRTCGKQVVLKHTQHDGCDSVGVADVRRGFKGRKTSKSDWERNFCEFQIIKKQIRIYSYQRKKLLLYSKTGLKSYNNNL